MVHGSQNPHGIAERLDLQDGGPGSEVEADETFVGGKAKNMHASRRAQFKVARETSMTGDANLVNKTAFGEC